MDSAHPFPAHPFQTDDERLRPVHAKIIQNERLDANDIVSLYRSRDILAIGWMADFARERSFGHFAQFCVLDVVSSPTPDGFTAETFAVIEAQGIAGLQSVVLAGSDVPLDRYLQVILALRQRHPDLRIVGPTPAEAAQMAGSGNYQGAVSPLREAGLDAFLGEPGEFFMPAMHLEPLSMKEQSSLLRAASRAGIETPMVLIPGYWRSEGEYVAEILEVRALCDECPGKAAISLLSQSAVARGQNVESTGMQEMKHVAIARLVLDGTRPIRVSWEALGPKLSQLALRFGASEINSHFRSGAGETLAPRTKEVQRVIAAAGREPRPLEDNGKRVVVISL